MIESALLCGLKEVTSDRMSAERRQNVDLQNTSQKELSW